jgi:uncharacterized RDD family membrane protein YckC
MSDDSIIDDFSVPSGKRLSTLTISKSASQVLVDVHGNPTKTIKNIKIPYVVPTVTPGIRFLYYLVELFVISNISITLIISSIYLLHPIFPLMLYFFGLFLYYFISEAIGSTTIVKAIFGYTVINDFGQKITLKEAALRSLSRYVPFETFSCLGSPSWGWHDKWTKTYVVKKSEVKNIQLALNKN